MPTITIRKPDDFHLHLRNDSRTALAIAGAAANFARAIVMPNLQPPVTTVAAAAEYQKYLQDFNSTLQYLMTLYLTDNTSPQEIEKAAATKQIIACKLYPAGATTNSENGVTDFAKIEAVLAKMEEVDLPLLLHGEVTTNVDVFDREKIFLTEKLIPLIAKFPNLRIVCEHITTKEMANFVATASDKIAATITPQHLLLNRNALLDHGLKPHNYCIPVLKREEDRQALIKAALSGSPKFFAGTDSAPHRQADKESASGCAGCYTSPHALSLYAEVFEQNGGLESQTKTFEYFLSTHGARFYRLPLNSETITLTKKSWTVPTEFPLTDGKLIPFWAGRDLSWQIT